MWWNSAYFYFHVLICFPIFSGKNMYDFKYLGLQVRQKALDFTRRPVFTSSVSLIL